jgi:hypothetical protein
MPYAFIVHMLPLIYQIMDIKDVDECIIEVCILHM